MQWMSSSAVSTLWKHGFAPWRMPSSDWWGALPAPLKQLFPEHALNEPLEKALVCEAHERFSLTLQGILRYHQQPYQRDVEEPEILHQIDQVRLLFYPASKPKSHVCFIPSLINRYYILDLSERLSLVRYLNAQGISASIIDWDEPRPNQTHFRTEDYLTRYVFPFLALLRKEQRVPLTLAGYCMGGLLALAALSAKPACVDSVAFLATPWDFHTPEFPRIIMNIEEQRLLGQWIDANGLLPADTIQMLFYYSNPWLFHTKFQQFAKTTQPEAIADFVAIEAWVNDGVAMTAGLAKESLVDWVQCNKTAKGEWVVCDKKIQPQHISKPAFIAAPQDDRIVPLSSALALATQIPKNTLITPYAGHVSMVVGGRRKTGLWNPFCDWLKQLYN